MGSPQIITYPSINGNRYSGNSVEAVFNGILFTGFKSITYSEELMPADVYGAAADKIGRTRGQAKPEASFVMYKEEYQNLILTLGLAGQGYKELPFDIRCVYFELGQIPIMDELLGCRITKDENSVDTGSTDALSVNVTLNVMHINLNTTSRGTFKRPITPGL